MQFLSLSRRLVDQFPPGAFSPELIAREGHRVRQLYSAGILRQVWKRDDLAGAAILWEAASESEVREAIASLPLSQAGMVEIAVFTQLEPYPGLGAV
jgi:muconolactone delta-isomerase